MPPRRRRKMPIRPAVRPIKRTPVIQTIRKMGYDATAAKACIENGVYLNLLAINLRITRETAVRALRTIIREEKKK